MDNAPSRRSNATEEWFEAHDRLQAVFEPTHHPWVNCIERLWKQFHATVTRHHPFDELKQLNNPVDQFVPAPEPFSVSDPPMGKRA